jgi:hypothetical protein
MNAKARKMSSKNQPQSAKITTRVEVKKTKPKSDLKTDTNRVQ